MTTVILHIGAFKTGTSYLQAVLEAGRERLAEQGVLWPGTTWQDHADAARGLIKLRRGPLAAWDALASEIDRWPGGRALVSSEALSAADERGVAVARRTLGSHQVRIVLTTRDLGRVLPAQWQESVQNGKTWPYREYVAAVTGHDRADPAYRHFWAKHDWGRILRTWRQVADGVELVVVTAPPPGASRDLLWLRFCEATGLPPDAFDTEVAADEPLNESLNESLGAASAEVVRHVSLAVQRLSSPLQQTRAVKYTVAMGALAPNRPDEPALVLPEDRQQWAQERSEALIADLASLGVRVVGDLAELRPCFHARRDDETDDPGALPASVLLAGAGAGLVRLTERLVASGVVPGDRRAVPPSGSSAAPPEAE